MANHSQSITSKLWQKSYKIICDSRTIHTKNIAPYVIAFNGQDDWKLKKKNFQSQPLN